MKKLLSKKVLCLIIAGSITTAFTACSNDDDPDMTPGIISATQTEFTSYAMTGSIQIPVKVSNPDAAPLDPKLFKFSNYRDDATTDMSDNVAESTEEFQLIHITTAEPTGNGNYILTAKFSHNPPGKNYMYHKVNATICYEGTDTSIPFQLTSYNTYDMSISHLSPGQTCRLTFVRKPDNSYLPAELPTDLELTSIQANGSHAENVSFVIEPARLSALVKLDKNFKLTQEENIPVTATMSNGISTFQFTNTLKVCPYYVMDEMNFKKNEQRIFPVSNILAEMGVEVCNDYEINTEGIKYYFAHQGERLINTSELNNVFPGTSYGKESSFILMASLPAGSYILVAHAKKLLDANDNKFIDIQMPFTIQ